MDILSILVGLFTGAVVPGVLWGLDRRRAMTQEAKSGEREKAAERRAELAEAREKAAEKRAEAAEDRERRADERAQASAKELENITRRGDAPRFMLSEEFLNGLYVPMSDGRTGWISATSPALLCAGNRPLPPDAPAGTELFLLVKNVGEAATMRVSRSSGGVKFGTEPEMKSAKHRQFFYYSYEPEKLGTSEQFEVAFETQSGRQDIHIYELVHGQRILRRVDPP